MGKIGGIACQLARHTRDLSSAFCRGVPPVKRIAREAEAEVVIFHQVVHIRSAGVGGLPDELGFDGCAVGLAPVAVVVYLNGIPDRVCGKGTGKDFLTCIFARGPDLHRIGQVGSLAGGSIRIHGISGRDGFSPVGGNRNRAGGAVGIDDAAIPGHGGRSGLLPAIGQLIRNAVGRRGIGMVGDLNRPGHLVTLVEDGVAHRICQLHRLLVPHHAGQRLVYGDFRPS